ncbi:MAG TPA: response regulator [Steroidobacteraceae bacterium]|nr:response regulator [Steroidobacteraceae bacterium]
MAPLPDATESRSALLASLGHEIRTPLNAIVGLTHLLAADLEHDARSSDKLSKIVEAANQLLGIFELAPPVVARKASVIEAALVRRHAGTEILVAEDNEVNREVARLLLGRVGLVVQAARDGREAVAMARTKHYALVLMDLQMPRLDGLDATAEIRELPGWEETPIVAMTANALLADRERCLAAGMSDHLAKPVTPAGLYECLLRWLPAGATDR